MSQTSWMRGFDAASFTAFLDTGLADRARYYAPSASTGTDCTALVDRDLRDYGTDAAPVATGHIRISLRRDEVAAPQIGGRVVLLDYAGAEAEQFRLAGAIAATDESLTHWVVEPHA